MNSAVPKQFLEIAGKPILLHTIESIASLEEVSQIIVALPEEHIPAAAAILDRQPLRCGSPVRCPEGPIARNRCAAACVMFVRTPML